MLMARPMGALPPWAEVIFVGRESQVPLVVGKGKVHAPIGVACRHVER